MKQDKNIKKFSLKKIVGILDSIVAKIASVQYAPKFAYFSVAVLALTTTIWSIFGANVHQANSDQVVNSYLFSDSKTFKEAQFPGAHTFIIKFPLFLLIHLLDSNSNALMVVTTASVLATIAYLVFVIRKIEKRPLVVGTLCLALASVLLLIPAQPIDGTPLPLNMAMLTTRNIEYVLFIASLALIIRTYQIKNRSFWFGVVLLGLLVASDKLFLILAIGGALLSLIAYSLMKGWNLVSLSVNWLVGSVLAGILGTASLALIKSNHITQIVNQANTSPYSTITNIHDFILGSIYSLTALFSNFGANPAYDAGPLKTISSIAVHRLLSLAGPAYIINALLLVAGVGIVWKILRHSFDHNNDRDVLFDEHHKLSIVLIWASLAAILSFIGTKHYYPVDGRYLTIALFMIFITAATYLRNVSLDSKKIVWVGLILLVSICSGLFGSVKTYRSEVSKMSVIEGRNDLVAKALDHHKVNVLVGDYWRVVPIKTEVHKNINITIMPLGDCSNVRTSLSSKNWQKDLGSNSFAYLLTLEKSVTDFPECSLNQVIASYGRPNASVLIAGTQDTPQELLLFYDNGANKSAPLVTINTPSTILPIKLTELPYTSCPTGKSIMNVVAHQDDDLLFINPDTLHSLQAGDCIRTVYLTAGDGGSNQLYWLGREGGSEAAYATMESSDNIWVKRIVQLGNNQYVEITHPRNDYQASLIFFRLPDGNLGGQGFRQTLYESLAKLDTGKIPNITSVDGQSKYTEQQLVSDLSDLMRVYGVDEIRTQSSYISKTYPDHSDHITAGKLARLAERQYTTSSFEGSISIPITYYTGYPVREGAPNVAGLDLIAKQAAFYSYAQFDKSVCSTSKECQTQTYGQYLPRQYQKPD